MPLKGKVGSQTRLINLFSGTALYNRATMKHFNNLVKFNASEEALFRVKVLEFQKKYGTASAVDAFSVSRSSIFSWKKKLKESKGKASSLIPASTVPLRKRVSNTPLKVISFIRKLREKHIKLGKEKIKPLLDKYCLKESLAPVSESTIGRVIKRHKLYLVSLNNKVNYGPIQNYTKHKRPKRRRVRYAPRPSGFGYIEIDTITKFICGIKYYIFNALDVKLKFQFSYGYQRLNSENALNFFKKLELVYPLERGIKAVQTDNGLEFLGRFQDYLKVKRIKHFFIYPRCPRINGVVERANRSLQEEFINEHEFLVLESMNEFNNALMDHLVWYNTERVHKTLGNISPMDYLLKVSKESNKWWTYTIY